MPWPAYVLRLEAAALKQLLAIEAAAMAQNPSDHGLMHLARLRRLARAG
jgi:hypothetical protein